MEYNKRAPLSEMSRKSPVSCTFPWTPQTSVNGYSGSALEGSAVYISSTDGPPKIQKDAQTRIHVLRDAQRCVGLPSIQSQFT
jgi:hypothetical protein